MANVTVYVVTTWSNLPSQTSPLDATALNHLETGVKNVTDFVNSLNADAGIYLCGAPFTQALLNKLNGIEAEANKYVLPVAAQNALGGVKIDGTTITIDANGVISSTTSGVSALENLTDVDLDNLADGQILKWDATNEKWVNTSEAEVRTQLSQLTDVELTNLEDGQTLKWDEDEEKWVNGDAGDVLGYDDTLDILGFPPNPIYRIRLATPVMTGYSTPSGEVIETGHITTYYGWYSFARERESGHFWSFTHGGNPCYLGYHFDYPTILVKVEVYNYIPAYGSTSYEMPKAFKIQGSNDGSSWTDLAECTITDFTSDRRNTYEFENSTAYRYYRLYCTEYNSGQTDCSIGVVNMYEKYLA